MRNVFLSLFSSFLSIACIMSATSCSSRDSYQREEGMIWNTVYHITYESERPLGDSIINILESVGKSLSVFDKSSLVCKVNETDSLVIDGMFADVYKASLKINEASDGMFDPTISPLITAWGFGPGHEISADTAAIDSILKFTGIKKTRLEGDRFFKDDKRIQFNFSAIAKGYGCDMVAKMLRRNGIDNYLVEIGGELAIGGKSPRSDNWKISIDRPVQTDSSEIHDSSAVIAVTDCGVATSGNYRNFHKEGKKTFGHTISPVTGYPVETDVISATVVAPDCMLADGAATACMASGSEAAKVILSRLGYEGMLILSDSSIWTTPGFNRLLTGN